MDADFSKMVKNITSDPDAMSKLMSMAQGLMGGGESAEKTEIQPPVGEVSQSSDLTTPKRNGNEERIALIYALRPFLSDTRRKNADNLIKMLKMMKLADINKLLGSL